MFFKDYILSNMRRILLLVPFLFLIESLFAQQENTIRGQARDANTNEALAFVNVIVNEGRFGGTTDIDGKFAITSLETVRQLTFSYIGYEKLTVSVSDLTAFLNVKLQPLVVPLNEVVVYAGENPAHRIIDSVLKYSNKNNPEKLKSFSYTAYDKMVFTVDLENFRDSLVSVEEFEADTTRNKDFLVEIEKFVEERDFFIMETVTDRVFMAPDKSNENIRATKMSGFKDPLFIYLLSEVQSTSFYNPMIHIMGKNYVNPISGGSKRKYLFILEEITPVGNNDSIYTISYRPFKNTNFDGLQGVLTIHSDNWAIQNVKAEPYQKGQSISIKIQQLYEKVEDEHWFPKQLNTDIIFNAFAVVSGDRMYPMVGVGKSYLKDITINQEVNKKMFSNVAIDVDPYAAERPDDFWTNYRIDSLTDRVRATYGFIDSAMQEEGVDLDKVVTFLDAMSEGGLPIGKVNLDLNEMFRFNDAQGIFLGLGLQTNHKFSKTVRLGGFWGYGFGNKKTNFGLNSNFTLNRFRELTLSLKASRRSLPNARFTDFSGKESVFRTSNFKDFFINSLSLTDAAEMQIGFRALTHFKFYVDFAIFDKHLETNYLYVPNTETAWDKFQLTNLKLSTRFAYKEKFMRTTKGIRSLGTDYPIVWLAYTKSFEDVFGGDFSFNKFEFQVEKSWYIRYLGKTSVLVQAALLEGDAPMTELFDVPGTWRKFDLYAPQSFATMRVNEFLSDRFAALFFTHNFGKLLFKSKKFSPEFSFATNIAWGDISNADVHANLNFDVMNKGYYESGIVISLFGNALAKIGVGAFYRYGPYSYSQEWKNFGWKYSISFGL